MTADLSQDDYCNWDWLPQAAREAEAVLSRLLAEPSIKAHVITARAKTIESFLKKCAHKEYPNPMAEVTDTVAARIITYSVTDRDRVAELVRVRFHVKENEDRNPGDERPVKKRGYDCIHLVVTGERVGSGDSGWLIRQGYLANYFKKFGGLEIQVRTVAAHAWAEFEHARRYKGEAYHAVTLHDQATVDQLFGAAADARKALDEIFESIDRVLANPSQSPAAATHGTSIAQVDDLKLPDNEQGSVEISLESLEAFLADRFPEDEEPTEADLAFACDLVRACGIPTVEDLARHLAGADSDQIRVLMATDVPVTTVRRLDDELLAVGGEEYIRKTGEIGRANSRTRQLEWRYDRVRGKSSTFELRGGDVPEDIQSARLPAARAVRETARIIANMAGVDRVEINDRVSKGPLPVGARAREVPLEDGGRLWVSTNLNRGASRELIAQLLARAEGAVNVQVFDTGQEIKARQQNRGVR